MLGLRAPAPVDAQEPTLVADDVRSCVCASPLSAHTHVPSPGGLNTSTCQSQQQPRLLLKRPAPAAAADADAGAKRQAV